MSSGDVVKKIEQTEETAYRGVYSDSRSVDSLLTYAYKFKGKPYRGGGTGPFAFDCSGFTSFVYKHFGYVLTHNSAAQTNFGVAVSKSDVSPGDLVFFKGGNARSSRIGHVGIASRRNDDGTFSFIHASTSQGVIESRSNERYYAVRYVTARRLIGPGTGKSDVKEESENVEGLMETLASGETVKKSEKTYTVKRGDNLSVIAQRNGCTVSDLKNWNGLRSNRLAVGQKLKLNVSDENAKGIDGEKQQTTTVTYVISDYQTGRRYDKELEELEEKDEPGYHTVGKGESLYTLAVRYGCRVNDIRKWNQLKSTSVYEGQRLRIADPEEVKVARESTREEIKEPEAKEEKVEPIATEGTKQIDRMQVMKRRKK